MDDVGILPVAPAWEAAVLVCCNQRPEGAKRSSCGAKGLALRDALKLCAREAGARDRVLVASTSCLGVCSPWGTTVAVLVAGRRTMWVVAPGTPPEAVWSAIAAVLEKE